MHNAISATVLTTVFGSWLMLSVLVLLCFWLIPGLRLDLFRQDMFAVRDELFDFAAAGSVSFQHPAYRLLRRSANGFIRYAHRLTVFQVIMTVLEWKIIGQSPDPRWAKEWNASLSTLDEPVRAKLVTFHERIMVLVLKRLIFGSPLLVLMLFALAVVTLCHAGFKSFRSALRLSAKQIVTKLIDTELLEEEAYKAATGIARFSVESSGSRVTHSTTPSCV